MIRIATKDDISLVLDLALMYDSIYEGSFKLDADYFVEYISLAISDPNHIIILDDNGFMLAVCSSFPWCKKIVCMDHLFFVRPGSRGNTANRIIQRYEEWAKSKNASMVMLGLASGINHDKVSRFYRFKGYKQNSLLLTKEL